MSIIVGLCCAILLFCVLLILTLFVDIPITVIVIASILFGVMNFLKALQYFS